MTTSSAPPRSLPPPSLPRELSARARVQALQDELDALPDPSARALFELELAALHEHGLHDRAQAVELYRRALRHAPGLLPALFALVRIEGDDGHTERVADLWMRIAEASTRACDRADALCEAGLLRLDQLGQRQGALELFQEALRVDPSCHTAALLLEQDARGIGNAKEADRIAEAHALACRDGELAASILVELSSAAGRSDDPEAALARLERGAELGARGSAVWTQIERVARKHKRRGQLTEALEALADIATARLRKAGESADAARERGIAAALLREAGRSAGPADGRAALAYYNRALALRPNDALLAWERSLAGGDPSDQAAARQTARALLDEPPADALAAAVRVRLSRELAALGEHDAAIEELRAAVAIEPRSAAVTAAIEDDWLHRGRLEELRAHLRARAGRVHGQARAELLEREARLSLHEPELQPGALELLRAASEASGESPRSLRAIYGAAVLMRQQRAAVEAASTLCAQPIEAAERCVLRFDQYLRLLHGCSDAQAARALLEQALLEPENLGWAPQAARLQAGAARTYPLLAAAHRALAAEESDPGRSAAHQCAAARALLRIGAPDAAADLLRGALARTPDDAYALALLEQCLLSTGDEIEAAKLLRDSARSHADSRRRELGLLHAGAAAESISDLHGAARAYEEAAAHDGAALAPLWALRRLGERTHDAVMLERADTLLCEREARLGAPGLYTLELGEKQAARGHFAQARAALGAALHHPEHGLRAALAACLLPEPWTALEQHDSALRSLGDAAGEHAELPLLRDRIAAHLHAGVESGKILLEAALTAHPDDAALACMALTSGPESLRADVWLQLARATTQPQLAAELSLHAVRVALVASGNDAAQDGLLRALEAAEQAPDSLEAAVAVDETLAPEDDPEARATALFGRLAHARDEASAPLRAARARALLASGRGREAADEARRALRKDPGDLGALDLLRMAARKLGDFESVAESAQRLAEHATGRFRALLLEEAALALEHELGRSQPAEALLNAAFEAYPQSELAFARLHDALLDRHDHASLLQLLERRSAATSDALMRADLDYERALVLRADGRKLETVDALEQLLRSDPDHTAAIGLLIETCTALERWGAAVAALRRLASANVPSAQRRLARLGAAELLERRLGDPDAARAELQALREAAIDDSEVLTRLGAVCERSGRYRQAVEVYREAAARAAGKDAGKLLRKAADVLRLHLGASNEAAASYTEALEVDALDAEACARVMELEQDADSRERVLTRFERAVHEALEREPARPELLRLLRRSGEWRGRRDVELVALSALHALGAPEAVEDGELERLSLSAHAEGPSSIPEAVLDRISDLATSAPLHRSAQLVATALAAIDPTASPATRAPDLRAETASQRYDLGRRAMAARLGVTPLASRPRPARRDALRAGLALAGRAHGQPEIEALGKQLGKNLSRAERKELSRALAALEQPEARIDAYLDVLELCLARAGLLAADDLSVALQQISGGAGFELETHAGAERALDLLRFWLSPRVLELRKDFGWGR